MKEGKQNLPRAVLVRADSGNWYATTMVEEGSRGLAVTEVLWHPGRYTVTHLNTGADFGNRRYGEEWPQPLTYTRAQAYVLLTRLEALEDWARFSQEDVQALTQDPQRYAPVRGALMQARRDWAGDTGEKAAEVRP